MHLSTGFQSNSLRFANVGPAPALEMLEQVRDSLSPARLKLEPDTSSLSKHP